VKNYQKDLLNILGGLMQSIAVQRNLKNIDLKNNSCKK